MTIMPLMILKNRQLFIIYRLPFICNLKKILVSDLLIMNDKCVAHDIDLGMHYISVLNQIIYMFVH